MKDRFYCYLWRAPCLLVNSQDARQVLLNGVACVSHEEYRGIASTCVTEHAYLKLLLGVAECSSQGV